MAPTSPPRFPPPPKALPPIPPEASEDSLTPPQKPQRDSLMTGPVMSFRMSSVPMMPDGYLRSDSPVSATGSQRYHEQLEPLTPPRTANPEIFSTPPPSAGTKSPAVASPIHRRPLNETDPNVGQHSRVPSFNPPRIQENDIPIENHQPLQYHHQQFEDAHMRSLSDRTSKLTLQTPGSGSHSAGDPPRTDRLTPIARNSPYGQNGQEDQRPTSRGRPMGSPSLMPMDQTRGSSGRSRSPDNRMSHVDLLNVPYPQAPPSGAENLVNTGLRTVVGNNASLLSTMKTLEMYKANVKKTNDPAIQYEFAVFMISAAQEEGLESEVLKSGTPQSPGGIRSDLLKEAKQILQKLCDRSYPFAQYYLADGYASGLFSNGKPDLERSFPLFLAASKHGHAEAMYRTALCYEWGWGCRVDAAKAVQFYQHAASKNHPGAMLRLGRACLTGDMGLGKRYREGVRWLKRGAESADFQYNQAPYDLACLHETGYGADVFKDESYAAQLYTKAADLGHKDSSFRLGEAYEFGQLNCPKDAALSIHFYTGAAEQGHAQAQMALCAWYMVGVENVLDKDESEAYEWARKAALNGLPKAQYTLGYFTEMGIGCRRDPLEANVWYVQAADQGEERAKHRIAAIRAAATGVDPVTAAKKGRIGTNAGAGMDGERKKRFGIF